MTECPVKSLQHTLCEILVSSKYGKEEVSLHFIGDLRDFWLYKTSSQLCTAVSLFINLKVQRLIEGSQVVLCKAEKKITLLKTLFKEMGFAGICEVGC